MAGGCPYSRSKCYKSKIFCFTDYHFCDLYAINRELEVLSPSLRRMREEHEAREVDDFIKSVARSMRRDV